MVVGVLPDGRKEVIALEDGYRESTESWASVLRDLKRRGMAAPILAVGDGNLGFWAALRDVYPEAREQRCWKHKMANVLDKLPKRLQPGPRSCFTRSCTRPTGKAPWKEIALFSEEYGARYPKAVETLTKDQDQLLTFFDFPAEHWLHLRTTNPIESTFATVKARTRKTKGAGSRKAGLAMAFKLLLAMEKRWRKVNAPHLVALVAAGVEFPNGRAEMFQPEPAPEDLFMPAPWIPVADELLIHNI